MASHRSGRRSTPCFRGTESRLGAKRESRQGLETLTDPRGNVKEKARILKLAGERPEGRYAAADLYAGIGYFAFSYARAGAESVLCWEINPWSVEGLRRGAAANGWSIDVVIGEAMSEGDESRLAALLVFQEDNQRAADRVAALRPRIAPIRHVNCGFLPSSKDSWNVALQVLDPTLGGWIHVHENIAMEGILTRKAEIVEHFRQAINHDSSPLFGIVECGHVERVKTFAPGKMAQEMLVTSRN
jgi:tRNA wybutosine-synthesizing protein 2